MKTSELTGILLAEWVARALGYVGADSVPSELCGREQIDDDSYRKEWVPHEDWAQGGPIIEREQISIEWNGECFAGGLMWGETPLIAAMRAYVASKYGDTVPDDLPNCIDIRNSFQ